MGEGLDDSQCLRRIMGQGSWQRKGFSITRDESREDSIIIVLLGVPKSLQDASCALPSKAVYFRLAIWVQEVKFLSGLQCGIAPPKSAVEAHITACLIRASALGSSPLSMPIKQGCVLFLRHLLTVPVYPSSTNLLWTMQRLIYEILGAFGFSTSAGLSHESHRACVGPSHALPPKPEISAGKGR